jgi:predicted dehydrogenase
LPDDAPDWIVHAVESDEEQPVESPTVKVGLIGCGTISKIYLENARRFPVFEIIGCADLVEERAKVRQAEFGLRYGSTVEYLLGDPEVELVLNLTIPSAHFEIALAALEAGKHIYNEKPLAIRREDGQWLVKLARERSLRVGCAPDTFLGGGLQTCRKIIDDGLIGDPVAATAFMLSHGHETWHPDPGFYYQPGGGPLFDMGPYYLTALAALIGPIRRVAGSARVTFPERTITSAPKRGEVIEVNTPTHVASVLDFATGAIGTLVTTFDVWPTDVPRIEVYGTAASLSVPDPNTFRGPIRVRQPGSNEWNDVPLTHGWTDNSRGIGLADMARGIRRGAPHRASGDLGLHVLDVMEAILESSELGQHVTIESTCDRPDPLPAGTTEFGVD